MSNAYRLGVADAMPNAAQTVDRFHVMQLFTRATDLARCQERRESAEKRALLRGTKYVWLKAEGSLTTASGSGGSRWPPSTCSLPGRAR
jgi:transposase